MTPDECRMAIPSYLRGELSATETATLEQALETNAELRAELEELSALWDDMGLLPQSAPSAALRARFYGALHALEQTQKPQHGFGLWLQAWSRWLTVRWSWPVALQAAAAIAIFASGLLIGRSGLNSRDKTEMARMNTQVQNLRELVALSLLDRQSAASRLEGVAYSSRLDRPNEEVVSALVRALNHDSNVNVRLSSLDALEHFAHEDAVSKALVDALDNQDSPLVQIALIDSLVNTRNRGAASELRKLTAGTQVDPAVRQRAQWGLQKLTYQ